MGGVLMYKLGTISEFNNDDNIAKTALGWTDAEIQNGKIISDEMGSFTIMPVIKNQINPDNSAECIWKHADGAIDDNQYFNIISKWTRRIINPAIKKYYIARVGDSYTCGVVEPGNFLYSDVDALLVYDERAVFLQELKNKGISEGYDV